MSAENEAAIQRQWNDAVEERFARPVGQSERLILSRVAFRGESLRMQYPGSGTNGVFLNSAAQDTHTLHAGFFGAAVNKTQTKTIDLSHDQVTYLGAVAEQLPDAVKVGNEEGATEWIRQMIREQPESMNALANDIAEKLRFCGAIAIRGLRFTDVPATPERYQPKINADVSRLDVAHLYVSSLVGEPYGTGHVRGGRLLTDVIPRPGFEEKQDSAFGSRKMFDFHVDSAVQPDTMPDYFALNCMRNTLRVPTLVSSVGAHDVSEEAFKLLQQPVFDLSYAADSSAALEDTAVITPASDGSLQYGYYGGSKIDVSKSVTNPSPYEHALEQFDEALNRNATAITLEPGDIAVVDNKRILHARPAFNGEQVPQPMGRWLRRVHIATSPELVARIHATNDRVLYSKYV